MKQKEKKYCEECREQIINPHHRQKYHKECAIKKVQSKNAEYRKTYKSKNPNKVKESQKKWRDKNPDYDMERNKVRILTPEQKERKTKQVKKWQKKNRVKVNKWKKDYLKKPEVRKRNTTREYAKKFLEKYLREICNNQCEKCKNKENLQLHHVVYNNNLQKEIYKKLKIGKGKKELKKILMLLCENCHIKIHKEDKNG